MQPKVAAVISNYSVNRWQQLRYINTYNVENKYIQSLNGSLFLYPLAICYGRVRLKISTVHGIC